MVGIPKNNHRRARFRTFEGLTDLEARFVNEYLMDMDATAAYERAGYNSRYAAQDAFRLRRKEKIANAIAKAMVKRNSDTNIDAKFVLIEAAFQYREASVRAAQNPKERGHALKALDMIGKHVNVLAFRQQVGLGNLDGTNYDLSNFSDEELEQFQRLALKALGSGDGYTSGDREETPET